MQPIIIKMIIIIIILHQGWKMASKKPRFLGFLKKLKNLKSPKFRFFYFLVKFYINHIKFHILVIICEFCYILKKML